MTLAAQPGNGAAWRFDRGNLPTPMPLTGLSLPLYHSNGQDSFLLHFCSDVGPAIRFHETSVRLSLPQGWAIRGISAA
jgi:hypothetical protein